MSGRIAHVYVDGQNLAHSARKFFDRRELDIDVPGLVRSIVARERGVSLGKINFYTGVKPPDGTERDMFLRARNEAALDLMEGMSVFTNKLRVGKDGFQKETGIDLKIATDMICDLAYERAHTFIILSNDRDFEPAFELVRDIAKKMNKIIDMGNMICGPVNGCKDVRKIRIPKEAVLAHIMDAKKIDEGTTWRMESMKSHPGHWKFRDSDIKDEIGPKSEPVKGTKYYVDLNSLGEEAKDAFGRTHLDAEPEKLVRLLAKDKTNRNIRVAAYLSIHDPRHDLVGNLLSTQHAADLRRRNFEVREFPYEYRPRKFAEQNAGVGPNTAISAPIAIEKRVKMQILRDVAMDVLSDRCDDICIVSDDHNLWPIHDLVWSLGRGKKIEIGIENAHIGERGIDGMKKTRIDDATYQACIVKDRLAEAKTDAVRVVREDLDSTISHLKEQTGLDDIEASINPEEAEGKIVGKSKYWHVMRQDEGKYAFYNRLPIDRPQADVLYRVTNGAMVAVEREHEESHSKTGLLDEEQRKR